MDAEARRRAITHPEVTGPYVADYSPRIQRLTPWQMILEYLRVLYA